jgi:hypothetical protein
LMETSSSRIHCVQQRWHSVGSRLLFRSARDVVAGGRGPLAQPGTRARGQQFVGAGPPSIHV